MRYNDIRIRSTVMCCLRTPVKLKRILANKKYRIPAHIAIDELSVIFLVINAIRGGPIQNNMVVNKTAPRKIFPPHIIVKNINNNLE